MENFGKNIKKITVTPIALSFWLPVILMTAYFAGRHMSPFGSSTILTVDLGQQYLDYFVQFKHTILQDPSSLFYSFSSGLGGDMLAEWSYYLMSPVNLLFLLATPKTIPVWILLATLIKIGFAGFSMALLIKKMNWQSGYWITIFAINYPLSAWFIANDLNLLWLDTAACLPLLILSLERLLTKNKIGFFLLMLVITIITNYYIAWMIALFLFMYLPFRLSHPSFKSHRLKLLFKTIKTGALGILLTAWLWLPTYVQLQFGKTTHNPTLAFRFDNNPFLLFFKLIPGSFDFDQMQTGQANFLIAPLIIFAAISFFTNRRFYRREKFGAFLIITILILATSFAPLTLLFHGGQYPVWYPARFSFLISFFLIILASRSFTPKWHPGIITRSILILCVLIITLFGNALITRITYLNKEGLLIFLFGYLITMFLLILEHGKWLRQLLIGITTASFLMLNLAFTLNNLSYLTNSTYQAGANRLVSIQKAIKHYDSSWYRVGQGVARTYNDGFLANLNTGSHFSSLLSASGTAFYRNIGQVQGDSKIAYLNGTTISDSLLGFKYFVQPKGNLSSDASYLQKSSRPDYNSAKTVASGQNWQIKENPDALPIAFAASNSVLNAPQSVRYPLTNQSNLLSYAAGKTEQFLIHPEEMVVAKGSNITILTPRITSGSIKKINTNQNASLTLAFTPTTNNPYYLNIGGAFDLDQVSIKLNGKTLTQSDSFTHTVDLNLLRNQKGKPQELTFTFQSGADSRFLDDLGLYYIDQSAVDQDIQELKNNKFTISKMNSRQIKGTIKTTEDKSLIMTSIPAAPGWQVTVDGHDVKPLTVMNGLMAIPTTAGMHHVTLTYTPPLFTLGLLLSILTVIFISMYYYFKKKRTSTLHHG